MKIQGFCFDAIWHLGLLMLFLFSLYKILFNCIAVESMVALICGLVDFPTRKIERLSNFHFNYTTRLLKCTLGKMLSYL